MRAKRSHGGVSAPVMKRDSLDNRQRAIGTSAVLPNPIDQAGPSCLPDLFGATGRSWIGRKPGFAGATSVSQYDIETMCQLSQPFQGKP